MKFTTLAVIAALSLASTNGTRADETKKIVNAALNQLMINKDVSAVDKYFAEPYVQHNQSVPDGVEGLRGLASQAIANNPAFGYKLVRLFTDGDTGIAHGVYEGFGKTPMVAFDIFRVENNKIVEHWDNLEPIAANNPSGHSQIDGPVLIKDLKKTQANKKLVAEFVEKVLIGGAFDTMPTYFDGDHYTQHNSNIGDGLTGLNEGLQALAKAGVNMRIEKVRMVYGRGNFVLAVSEGNINQQATAFYDLFRVENNKIAEHWDVISSILPTEQAVNSNGKF